MNFSTMESSLLLGHGLVLMFAVDKARYIIHVVPKQVALCYALNVCFSTHGIKSYHAFIFERTTSFPFLPKLDKCSIVLSVLIYLFHIMFSILSSIESVTFYCHFAKHRHLSHFLFLFDGMLHTGKPDASEFKWRSATIAF